MVPESFKVPADPDQEHWFITRHLFYTLIFSLSGALASRFTTSRLAESMLKPCTPAPNQNSCTCFSSSITCKYEEKRYVSVRGEKAVLWSRSRNYESRLRLLSINQRLE
jgi:hypothetical protein